MTSLTAAQQPQVLTARVRLVVLDVVVTDKAGRPVDGLTRGDFEVYEAGAKQSIGSFEGPSAHNLPAQTLAEGLSAVFDPAKPASFGQSPVDILVLDQANTRFADSSFARRSLHDYLARQPAVLAQPAALMDVYDLHFKQLQGFTRDRDTLLRALDKAPTEYAWKLEIYGKTDAGPPERLDQSLRALEQMAQSYALIPGRKNLIWVGGGFPTVDPTVLSDRDAREIKDTLQHVTNLLIDTRMTLYAVDPSSSAAGMTEITDSTQLEFAVATGDAMAANADPFGATDDFDKLGPASGGRVIRGKNDVAAQIADSIYLGGHFYTLSYTPTSTSEQKAAFRSIQVRCLRPGLTATTRTGYYAHRSDLERSYDAATYDLATAAETTLPLNGLIVTAEPDRDKGVPASTYVVHVSRPSLTWQSKPDGGEAASVYVMAVWLNGKNEMIGHMLHGMTANAKPGTDLTDASKTADFVFTAEPSAKASTLRFIVRDSANGRMGSFEMRSDGR